MTRKVAHVPLHGVQAVFHHRDLMRKRKNRQGRTFFWPTRGIPSTTLPVDGTNNAMVYCPMDGNDRYGDCMAVTAAHTDNIWTYGMGLPGWSESQFNVNALVKQYEAASGGDNGLDEPTLLQSIWKPGICGDPKANYVSSLDISFTNDPLLQFAIDNFFAVQMMWSVPDLFLQQFQTGAKFLSPMIADPRNGHGTPLADVDASGNYRLWTWGGWCWVSPSFIKSVDPEGWVTFSARQFHPSTGLDAKGRHITLQAAKWLACGGSPIPQAVINSFPPVNVGPPPVPPGPGPIPPTPTPVPVPVAVSTMAVHQNVPKGGYMLHQAMRHQIPDLLLSAPVPPGIYSVDHQSTTRGLIAHAALPQITVNWIVLEKLLVKDGPVVWQILQMILAKNWTGVVTLALSSAPGIVEDVINALGVVPPVPIPNPAP